MLSYTIVVPQKEWDDTKSGYQSNTEFHREIFSIVERFMHEAELKINAFHEKTNSYPTKELADIWRKTQDVSIENPVDLYFVILEAIILITSTWLYGEMFMGEVVSTFERAAFLNEITQRMAMVAGKEGN